MVEFIKASARRLFTEWRNYGKLSDRVQIDVSKRGNMPQVKKSELVVQLALIGRTTGDASKGKPDKLKYQAIGENSGFGTLYVDAPKLAVFGATPPDMVSISLAPFGGAHA